ncbi:MAG: type II secretion system F family protein [Planctomycetota bacterium]|jgi:type IV pilus assembly protein PilC|nr:type II secretion system protein F [Planctomycetota bacterium]MDP6839747.1 type II secretion system F family protein [Planctomycetota bacterium]
MNTFQYSARERSGKLVAGTLQAESREEATRELRERDLLVLSMDADAAPRRTLSLNPKAFFARRTKPGGKRAEVVLFTRQLSTMVAAGLALLECLEVLAEQAETAAMRATCERLVEEVRGGTDLSTAMGSCPRVFPPLYISMVQAGEVSGQMDLILARLADYLESSEELKREIRAAMTYPVVSLVLVLAITGFLMVGVVPTFKEVFDSLDAELPTVTLTVLAISDWLRGNVLLGLAGVGSLVAAFFGLRATRRGAYLLDKLRLGVPVFGVLARKVALARFSRTFSTLIRSGVPILPTLEIVSATAGNQVISRAVLESRENVRVGNPLSEPLARGRVFPPMVVRMIAIGERTGALETLMDRIAAFYDSEVKAQVKSLTSLIEPILITFMGFIVGGVVLAIFMPILDMIGNLGGS